MPGEGRQCQQILRVRQHGRIMACQAERNTLCVAPARTGTKPLPAGVRRQRGQFGRHHSFVAQQTHLAGALVIAAPVHLVHACIDGRGHLRHAVLAQGALRQHGEVRHGQHRTLKGECQALHDADGNTYTGERTGTTSESDGVQRRHGNARLGHQAFDHGQQPLGVQARDHLVVAQYFAVMQQSDRAGFSGGVQGQQGGHRCFRRGQCEKVQQYK